MEAYTNLSIILCPKLEFSCFGINRNRSCYTGQYSTGLVVYGARVENLHEKRTAFDTPEPIRSPGLAYMRHYSPATEALYLISGLTTWTTFGNRAAHTTPNTSFWFFEFAFIYKRKGKHYFQLGSHLRYNFFYKCEIKGREYISLLPPSS